jgi:hypothetical protein
VQLTESQIPRHSHGVSLNTNTQGHQSHPYIDALFPEYIPAHSRNPDFGMGHAHWSAIYNDKNTRHVTRGATTSGSGDHMDSVSGRTTGTNTAFDTIPPFYVVVYIVHR